MSTNQFSKARRANRAFIKGQGFKQKGLVCRFDIRNRKGKAFSPPLPTGGISYLRDCS